MTVIFQSHHQFEFCDRILRNFAEDDGDSLLVATSSQEVSLASLKMLQIFSPLLREIVETLPSSSAPHTLIIPDTDAESWKYLTGLLTTGSVDVNLSSDNSNIKCQKDKISSLAQCLRIYLETKQVSEETRVKLRVKRPEELGSIHPPISNQETNIVNNDYDSDKEEEKVAIKSENLYSNNCASSEHSFPIHREKRRNESEKLNVQGGDRCNDSGIDIESCLGVEHDTFSQAEELHIPPLTEKILLDNQESFREPEFSGIKDRNKNQIEKFSLTRELNIVKLRSQEELVSCDEARSEGEIVSSDEAQSQSFSDDSRSSGESESVQAAKGRREELRLRWQKKDENLFSHAKSQDKLGFWYNKDQDPSGGQDDNTKIYSANMQDSDHTPQQPQQHPGAAGGQPTASGPTPRSGSPFIPFIVPPPFPFNPFTLPPPQQKTVDRSSQQSSLKENQDKKRLELEREEMEEKKNREKRSQEVDTNNDPHTRKIFTCPYRRCKDLEFHTRGDLKRHSKVHSTPVCSRCKKEFKYEDSLFEHMNAAHLKIRRPYVCSECPDDGPPIFVSIRQLEDHLRRVHSKKINRRGYSFENESASFLYQTEACHKA